MIYVRLKVVISLYLNANNTLVQIGLIGVSGSANKELCFVKLLNFIS